MKFYCAFLKRYLDFVLAFVLVIVLFPFGVLLCILIVWRLGRPVIFVQDRPGQNERLFRMVKFRSMTNATGPDGELLADEARLSPFGLWLRKTSLDELPELWNVLKGDMSLVGPRPLLVRYLPYFTEVERARFLVRPGITGLAQIRGRNLLSWPMRLACDVQYVEQLTWKLDLKILLATPFKVFTSSGVVQVPGNAMQDLDVERKQHLYSKYHANS